MKRGLLLTAFLILLSTVYGISTLPSNAAPQAALWPNLAFAPLPYEFDTPVFLTHAGDGSGRLFVVEQAGYIRVVDNGQVASEPFLDIEEEVLFDGEQGLLSMAFAPDYQNNGRFYVYYTDNAGDNVVVRYRVSDNNPNVADPDSAQVVLPIPHPTHGNHNGGQLQFGPDGMLYIGIGDGGGANDEDNNAQSPGTILGKILRINVEQGNPTTYTIPSDNPFVNNTPYRGEIWSVGVRNPWRFSFDRETGDMYMGDVGQGQWEEVNFQPAGVGGQNWGWRCYEGLHTFNLSKCDSQFPYDMPVAEYNHSEGCSITGGYVYRGTEFEALQGIYFFTDYCSGIVWGLQNPHGSGWIQKSLADLDFGNTSFGEDEAGIVYLLNGASGRVFRIEDRSQFIHLPLIQYESP
jgi:glucose/arabinose dehydrogenase